MATERSFKLGGERVFVDGVSDSDVYFQAMGDGVEDAFYNFCRRHLPPTAIAIDVGANIGITSAILSQCLPAGHVYAFEPAATVFPILQHNVRRNGLANVTISNMAVSDKVGTAHFHDQSAYGHIVRDGGHVVNTTTIDELVYSEGLATIDFVKIDVEGFEPSVLAGGAQVIARHSPLIYMEFNPACLAQHSGTDPFEFMAWILANFSHVYAADPSQPALVRELDKDDAADFLRRNMVRPEFLVDLAITNNPTRLRLTEA